MQLKTTNFDKTLLVDQFQKKLANKLAYFELSLSKIEPYTVYGKVISAIGTTVEAYLPDVKIGDLCKIVDQGFTTEMYAEVVSLKENQVKLLPFGPIANISQGSMVQKLGNEFKIAVGDFLLGKVVNGFGEIIGKINPDDNLDEAEDFATDDRSIQVYAPDPFDRPLISEPFITGISAIDLFNTCGVGQRVGIFAGPGVGKTTLIGMILRNSLADVVVIALVGERGREVREFIELEIDQQRSSRYVLVVATSDRPPVEQLKSAYIAQTIAEYFRDQGKKVLLFMDSLTRFARAGREVGLSSGEPIIRNGYPSSVFLSFPKLLERVGIVKSGSITAFYTVLMEGDDISQDPISDEVKSIIDGHILLSKKIAERDQFPAVDILKSLSRVADRIIEEPHLHAARHIKLLLSRHADLEFLIRVGEYVPGQDQVSDEAIAKYPEIISLLKQNRQEAFEYQAGINRLIDLANS